MKVILRVYKWIIFSLIFQILFLIFLNNYYLVKGVSIKATSFEVQEEPKEDKGFKVPPGAEDIKVSFDGSYIAYLLDGMIKIKDIKTEKDKDTLRPDSGRIDYYKWLPDRDIIIYSIKLEEKGRNKMQISTKDLESDLDHKYPVISGLSNDSEVLNIEVSPLTNVVYAKIKSSSSQAKVYKFDINNDSYYIMNISLDADIKEINYKDAFLYEDSTKNRVRVWDGIKHSSREVRLKEKNILLGIDAEDKVYVGNIVDSDKISKILYGKLDEQDDEAWAQIDLNEPVDSKNIIVSSKGQVLVLDDNEKTITNVQNNEKIEYEGDFIEMLDDYIVYLDNDKVKLDVIDE